MESAASSNLTSGTVFAARYRVERKIAEGGMGAVYEVIQIETNRRRALKVMLVKLAQDDDLRARFRQEARLAAEIESEHIVDVVDAGIDETTAMPFLVMELLRGEELGKLVKRDGALPKEDVVRYLYETSLALDKTHRARIVHRDLKPDNLFLCERDQGPPRVKVLDFGIAKIVNDAQAQANGTQPLGTPLYMAPEQFQMQSVVSAATDIYALGMIAFTMLVGKPYWSQERAGVGLYGFIAQVIEGPSDSPVKRAWTQYGIELPAAFDEWFFRATARDPAARFATAGQAVLALAEVLGMHSPAEAAIAATRASLPSLVAVETQSVVQSTAPLPDIAKSPIAVEQRTGPTLLAMAPEPASNMPPSLPKRSRRSRFPAAAAVAALMAGVGILLMIAVFSRQGTDEPREPAAQPNPVVSNSAVVVNVEPVVNEVVAMPEVSAVPVASSAPVVSDSAKPASTPIHKSDKPVAPKVLPAKPSPKRQVEVWERR